MYELQDDTKDLQCLNQQIHMKTLQDILDNNLIENNSVHIEDNRINLNNNMSFEKYILSLSNTAFQNKSRHITESHDESSPKIVNYNETQWKILFPSISNDKYKKLKMTDIGLYSIAKPHFTASLVSFIEQELLNYGLSKSELDKITITETHGGIGGFSLGLIKRFNNLNIAEINKIHAGIIKNNLEVYGYNKTKDKKVNIFNDNYLNIFDKLHQDVIICDPPWGGRGYVKEKQMKLWISNIDLTYIINYLDINKKFKLFIFLAPFNFDFNSFLKNIKTLEIKIMKSGKQNFVCIKSSNN